MFGKILHLLVSVTIFMGCSSGKPEIRAVCLRDNIGNYVIKWETVPKLEGTVKMSVSDNPDFFASDAPTIYANINDGVATYITNENMSRKYFRLTFNDKYNLIIGARSAVMDSVQNLRDIGGYPSAKGKRVKWGMVFRSGDLGSLTEWDSIRLDYIGIKTIIDLRTNNEVMAKPVKYSNAEIIHIPISIGKLEDAPQRVKEGKIKKGDAGVYLEDEYLQFVTDNGEQYAKAMDIFKDRSRYPILISCSFGKDRTGYLSAMLLSALNVPRECVVEDYLTSNLYINMRHLANVVRQLSTDSQESITVFLTAHESLLDLAFQKINKEYGSLDKYLIKELKITDNERDTLKDILLY